MVDISEIRTLVNTYEDRQTALLPVLHYIQDKEGCIPTGMTILLADLFNITQAELKGVLSFYHDFKDQPPTGRVFRMCRAEACQARGSEALAAQAQEIAKGTDTAVEAVYCLGLCASGPAADIDGKPVARLTAEKIAQLILQEPAS
ncbi:formate dehydrogenase subunit gamma [Kordiimonas sediminis]|uniref:Formate dehydrogenase subunit gamma n=1 Tax=Kordiimonas sediminis TaxID=1735581 RepID=A0A919E757_9PROT|nr:NAD(P)H-dependent oxidoreductase subunit E [Kordiimonas sediminis]GHF20532.1 formate dehydrogenase subunit gamma [Kordiimonas sediminis]